MPTAAPSMESCSPDPKQTGYDVNVGPLNRLAGNKVSDAMQDVREMPRCMDVSDAA